MNSIIDKFSHINRALFFEHKRLGPIKAIKFERIKQDSQWGEQNHHDYEWLSILTEELGEIANAINKHYLSSQLQEEAFLNMIYEIEQTAAVCVAWLECIYRNNQTSKAGRQGMKMVKLIIGQEYCDANGHLYQYCGETIFEGKKYCVAKPIMIEEGLCERISGTSDFIEGLSNHYVIERLELIERLFQDVPTQALDKEIAIRRKFIEDLKKETSIAYRNQEALIKRRLGIK